jgi:hypothetical protein
MVFDEQSAGLWLVTSTVSFLADALVIHVIGILLFSTLEFLLLVSIGLDNSTLPRPVKSSAGYLFSLAKSHFLR